VANHALANELVRMSTHGSKVCWVQVQAHTLRGMGCDALLVCATHLDPKWHARDLQCQGLTSYTPDNINKRISTCADDCRRSSHFRKKWQSWSCWCRHSRTSWYVVKALQTHNDSEPFNDYKVPALHSRHQWTFFKQLYTCCADRRSYCRLVWQMLKSTRRRHRTATMRG
jgi:hypothetical protein